jgi:mono/diheme cytochrome c family protein
MKKYLKPLAVTAALLSTHVCLQAQSGNATDKASIDRGKLVYEMHCLACHQADGAGVPNLNPPLTKTKWTMGDKNGLINVVLKGLDEEIEVEGETYSNVMPPMSYLSDEEIADVLTFVRNSFGNKASTVKIPEVKALREKLK